MPDHKFDINKKYMDHADTMKAVDEIEQPLIHKQESNKKDHNIKKLMTGTISNDIK